MSCKQDSAAQCPPGTQDADADAAQQAALPQRHSSRLTAHGPRPTARAAAQKRTGLVLFLFWFRVGASSLYFVLNPSVPRPHPNANCNPNGLIYMSMSYIARLQRLSAFLLVVLYLQLQICSSLGFAVRYLPTAWCYVLCGP
jgi:hypothetical protein